MKFYTPFGRCKLFYMACLFIGICASVQAGGSRADYERAEQLGKLFRGNVHGHKIKPNWLDESKLWYKQQIGEDEYEFILVDAESGQKKKAFDHDKFAEQLVAAGVKHAKAENLPIQDLKFNLHGNLLEFTSFGKIYKCDLKTCELQYIGDSEESVIPNMAASGRPLRSMVNGPEVDIVFENRRDQEVEGFWVNSSAKPVSYFKLGPGQIRCQNSYVGHVWEVRTLEGGTIGIYYVDGEHNKVLIGVDSEKQQPPVERRRPRRCGEFNGNKSPDGKWRGYIKDYNVFVMNDEDQQEYQLSTDGSEGDCYRDELIFSPDSKKLIAVRQKVGQRRTINIVESSPNDQLQPKLHTINYYKPGDVIDVDRPVLFDLETKKQIPISNELFPNPFFRNHYITAGKPDQSEFGLNAENHYRWDSDSSRFMFGYNQRGHQLLRIISVDASSGAARSLIDETSDTFICYSYKYYCNYLDKTNEIVWMSERDGWTHLYLYDSKTGKVKNQITKGDWVVLGVEYVDADKRQIWFTAGGVHPEQDPYYVHYCRVDFDGSNMVVLTKGDGTHKAEFSPDRKYMVDSYSRVDMAPVHELIRCLDGKKICELGKSSLDELIKTGWQTPIRFNAKGRDGATDIYGVIYRPTNFDPSQKYPVVEDIYAGPHTNYVIKEFYSYVRDQKIAEFGFVVVRIDGMGTIGRSKKFHDVCWKNVADAGFPDRIAWIKAAAKKYPWMDASNVGIFGGSAGGQNAAGAVMQYGDFYRVAVADCGCHDNRMDKVWWNEQWFGWPVGSEYEANSNVTLAKNLKGNLLLIVGEMDTNVDPATTMQVVDALVKADKDFDLLVIPGAGHGAAETAYGSRRRADYLVRHLLGVEPRW